MEANEQGLTTEERIMFAVLGIILVIAIGVLTVNYFSKHERKAEGTTNTSITEKGEQEDVVDIKEPINSEDDLKEAFQESDIVIDEGLHKITNTSNSYLISKSTTKKVTSNVKKSTTNSERSNKVVEEKNEGTGSTDQGEVDEGAVTYENSEDLDWTFNSNIVKESYADDIIKVPTTVILTDGTEKSSTVVLKEESTGKEITIENNEVILPAGKYIYYYTCNNKTKEIPLTVYNRLNNATISILNINESKTEVNEDLKYLLENSTITNKENNYKLTINRINNYNVAFLKVSLKEEYKEISTSNNNIELDNNLEHFNLKNNEFVIKLNLNSISLSKTNKVLLTIDGTEYLFNIDVSINNKTIEKEEDKEETENSKEEDKENKKENQDTNKDSEDGQTKERTPDEPKPSEETPEITEPTPSEEQATPTNNNLPPEVVETPPEISQTT